MPYINRVETNKKKCCLGNPKGRDFVSKDGKKILK
jgi:hypothetical protein